MNLKNNRGNIQRKSGKALYNVAESLPGDWQTFSDNNIRYSSSSRKRNFGHCKIWQVTLTALSFSISFILRIFLGLFINSMLNGVEIRKFGNE